MTRLLCSLVVSCMFVACTSDKVAYEVAEEKSGTIVASDTAQASTISFAEAKIDSFTLRYTKGEVYRYRVQQYSDGGPDTAAATTKSSHVYTKMVRNVRSDGSYEIAMRFDSIRINAVVRNRTTGALLLEQNYSSADSSQRANKDFVQFNALIGEEVLVYVSPRGAVLQVGDVSPIVNKMIATTTQTIPQQAIEQLSNQIKSSVYATFHGQEIVPFPTVKIDSNGNWVNVLNTPLGELFTVSTTARYHIVGLKKVAGRTLANIEAAVQGKISVRPLPKNAPFSVTLRSSSISGNSHSLLDAERGFTISKKNAITMNVAAQIVSPKGERKNVSQVQVARYEIELLR